MKIEGWILTQGVGAKSRGRKINNPVSKVDAYSKGVRLIEGDA